MPIVLVTMCACVLVLLVVAFGRQGEEKFKDEYDDERVSYKGCSRPST